ncbi:phage tail tape measure protein [Peribacillus loiseleuriae]|uniref:phage tail tape measure protein n=1 Tax=Peribacillus loiseleuriae TaxID=1679170 RepID=UPI00069EF8A1|nr:phage tail tape measure protein [Peribacillus loiseleuriae]
MAGEVGSLRVTLGLDSIDFTRGMQEINRKLTALNSEFKTTTAGAGRFDNSLDTLRQRSTILTSTLQTHRAKVNELNNQYQESVRVNGAAAASTEKLLIQYNNAVSAMRRTENQLQQTNRKIQEQSNGFQQLSTQINQSVDRITQQMRVLDSSFDAATAGIRDFGNSTQQLQQRSDHLTSSLRLQQQRVEELNRLHREAVREMGANARETQELEIRLNRATQAMRETEAQLRRTNAQIDNQSSTWNRLNSRLSSVGEQMQHIGGRMQGLGSEIAQSFGVAFLAVGGALGLTAKKAMDFESQMSSVKSVMAPDEINEFGDSLEKLALQMGAETKYSALEAAQGIEELIKAGLSPAQVASGGLEGALALATAGELELADAAEIASTALNAFKDDNLSVMRAADLLAGAANASATSVSEMKFGLSMVSAVASGVGLTFEDTAGALATFAQNGLKGSDAGTSLKTMLLNLSPSTKEATAQMSSLGLLTKKGTSAFYDANGSIKSMSEIAELLKTKLAKLTDEQRQMALKTMFGTDAIRAANILYKEGADGITHMVEAMNKIKSADVAAQKLDNVKGRILLLKGTLETAAIAIGNSLLPAIDKVVAVVQKAVDAFNNLSPRMQSFITIGAVVSAAFLGIVTALGAFIMIIGGAISGVGALISVFSAVAGSIASAGGAMALLTGPIGVTIASIAGIGIAATNLYNTFKGKAIPEIERFGDKVSESTKKALDGFFELSDEASLKVKELSITQKQVTAETKDALVSTYGQMSEQILSKMSEQHAKQIEATKSHFLRSSVLTNAEEDKILGKMEERNKSEVELQQNFRNKINEIVGNAYAENRALTEREQHILDTIREQMNEKAVKSLSQNEIESKVILERMKQTASNLSAQQAAEVVKNSIKQRTEAVNEADKQLEETIASIIRMRDESGDISAEQADRMISEAQKAHDMSVKYAEDMHSKVVEEAKSQAKEHVDQINWTTGEVLSKWEVMVSSLSGVWGSLRDQMSSAFSGIKDIAIQIFSAVASFLGEKFSEIKKFWDENGTQILEAISNVFKGIMAVIEFVMPAVLFIIQMVWTAIKQVIDGALNVIMGLIKVFSGLFTGDFGKMWEGIKQIFMGAIDVIIGWMTLTFVGGLRTLLTNLAKLGVNLVKGLADGIVGLFKSFTTTGSNLAKGMVDGVLGFFRNLYSQATNIFGTLRTFGASIWNSISQTILGIARNIWNGVVTNFTNMVTGIRNIFSTVRTTIESIWNGVMSFFRGINLTQIGKDIIKGLINGIGSMASAVWEKTKEIANGIISSMKKALDIHSPSKETEKIGKETGAGVVVGLSKQEKAVAAAAKKVAQAAAKNFKEAFDAANYKFKMGEVDASAHIKSLEKVRDNYAKTPEQIRKVNLAILDIEKKHAKDIEKLDKQNYDTSKKYIEKKKRDNEISLSQELAMWERVQNRYKTGSKEREEAEQNVYRVKKEIHDKLNSLNDEYVAKMQDVNQKLIDGEKALNAEYQKTVDDRAKSLYSFAGIFDEITQKSDVSGQQLMQNLQDQVATFAEWSANIKRLAGRGVSEDLLSELRDMGPRAAAEIAALNSLTDEQLAEYAGLWGTKNSLARKQATAELEGMKEDTAKKIAELHSNSEKQLEELRLEWENKIKQIRTGTTGEFNAMKSSLNNIGRDSITGMIKGLESMEGALMAKARAIANAVAETIRGALDIHSPSRVMMEIGTFVGEGLIDGMQKMFEPITNTASMMAKAATPNIPDTFTGRKVSSFISPFIQNNSKASPTNNVPNNYDYSRTMHNTIQITTNADSTKSTERMLRRLAFEF